MTSFMEFMFYLTDNNHHFHFFFVFQNIIVDITNKARVVRNADKSPMALVKIYSIGTFDDAQKNKGYSKAIIDFFNKELQLPENR